MACCTKKYPPPIAPGCQSHYLGADYAYGRYYEAPGENYFVTMRNLSRLMPPGVWGTHRPAASVFPDANEVNKIIDMKNLRYPELSLSPYFVDKGTRCEVDNFYYACQLFRDQYKDNTGKLHPLDYFQDSEVIWQCSPSMTRSYFEHPVCYPRYMSPPVLARALAHSEEWPALASQSLAGKAYRHHDTSYLR